LTIDYIALVRSGRDALDAETFATVGAASGPAACVFLHGDGVAWAGATRWLRPGTAQYVCQSSWRRRQGERSPPSPCRVGTLATLFLGLAHARRADSFAGVGSLCSFARDGRLLIEIRGGPRDERDAIETLELVLAAAALEFPACVLFGADGLAHLSGERRRRWRQLTDHDLMPVLLEAPAGVDLGAVVDGARADALRGDALHLLRL
jgi:hypothetical protein